MIKLAYPEFLWLLLLPVVVRYMLPEVRGMCGDALKIPFLADIEAVKAESRIAGRRIHNAARGSVSLLKTLLMLLLWLAAVAALCRPQYVGDPVKVHHRGRDIMLVADISNSMSERDFSFQGRYFTRLDAVKSAVSRFADDRPDDRIGLVLFGTRAYLQVPLTYDKQSLKEVLYSVDAGMAGNSTSIGDAVGLALKTLAAEKTKTDDKVIILLTDGENNDGSLSFPQAVKLAEEEKVKIYTVGVGSDSVPFFGGLFNVSVGQGIDEEGLKHLAAVTKGRYFRARDVQSLLGIYDEINKLEAEDREGRFVQERKDLFYYPAALALLLFLLVFYGWRKA